MTAQCLIAVICLGLCCAAGWGQVASSQAASGPGAAGAVVQANNDFAAELYGRLADGEENLFFSPGSIHTALAMTSAGAAGATAQEMTGTLHLPPPGPEVYHAFAAMMKDLNNPPKTGEGKPAYELSIANALWGQKGFEFRKDFTGLLQDDFGAAMHEVDFAQAEQARKLINDWVAGQTRDKIKDLIGQGMLNAAVRLVLTNAIYFKSNWQEPFKKQATADGPFTTLAGKPVDVPMMRQRHSFPYMQGEGFQAVELPYAQRQLSMVVFLPDKTDGLAELQKKLTAGNLTGWLKELQRQSVDLQLPRFKFAAQFGLGDALKAMGMKLAFDPDKADFSGMTAQGRLFISAVIHKAYVAVDEEGTEAAAATAVVMALSAMPMPQEPKVFHADHPFVFLIRHNPSGEILFMGRVTNPAK